MAEYSIRIRETLTKTVKVDAANAEQAREIVKKAYRDCDHVLDASHFESVNFTLAGRSERER
ncbi:MAG: DpnD/PcfM family protein [Oscillospiraceae bacterium]|jgi:hypothetical protein|nr:DpnD/PcfM family protein [Oscillospiraceae bacterium]